MVRRGQRDGIGPTIPIVLALLLALAHGFDLLLRSSLLQGDLPGHLESARWYATRLWPWPWGWDPRYLGGAPLGILYPPLLAWTVGGLGKLIGVEPAMRLTLLASVVALPPSLYAGARGLGLSRRRAGWACATGLAVLWLPWRGLGGSLHQTLVAGNAANALAMPLLGWFLGRMRRSVARPRRRAGAALLLGVILLGHFLVGAVAGLTLAAFAAWRAARVRSVRPLLRGLGVALGGLGIAAPFLLPFLAHLGEASPDAIAFNYFPHAIEWLALAGLASAVLLHPRWTAHPMLPMLMLAAVLYLCRGVLFPLFGTPPFRMEYHRFRLFLYLANVPAWWLLLQSRGALRSAGRGLAVATSVLLAGLFVFARYDAAGPAPVPLPDWRNDGHRVMVLASPSAQNGSWHGLQARVPAALDTFGVKGLFVEGSPLARAVFELEALASGPGVVPTRWAIRTDRRDALMLLDDEAVRRRFARLAVDRVLTLEPVSERLRRIAVARRSPPPRSDASGDPGYTLFVLPEASWAWRADDGSPLAATLDRDGTRLALRFDRPGPAIASINGFSDWRVVQGEATIGNTGDGLLAIEGRGEVTVRVAPRAEEWIGLGLGGLALALLTAGTLRSRPSRRRAGRR